MAFIPYASKPHRARKAITAFLASGVLLASLNAPAESIGPTYSISEPDLLKEIYRVLEEKQRSGELAKLQQEAIARSTRSAEEPAPVKGLVRTTTPRTFYYETGYRVPQTIRTPDGQVVAKAGDYVNPLDYVSLSQYLIFLDGTDPDQLAKARALSEHYNGRVKLILVKGRPFDLMRAWKTTFYFDQAGRLIQRFGIRQVPALVSQEGKHLRIDELTL